jgi:hypothetical protein
MQTRKFVGIIGINPGKKGKKRLLIITDYAKHTFFGPFKDSRFSTTSDPSLNLKEKYRTEGSSTYMYLQLDT